jgi:A/G-specific adenine glycosylase
MDRLMWVEPGIGIFPAMTRSVEAHLVRVLCDWFGKAARDLPWRKRQHRTGYGALVAETMLQQTQVARVAERYALFMRRFPSVRDLASAREQDVLELWQGMGYYRRARHLHQAAQTVVRDFRGRVPSDVLSLRQLPGVGRYTAGAIASIVFGKPEPIVDGNVARVLARVYGRRHVNGAATAWNWETAERLVRLAQLPGAGVFNEGLMELGATVCTPRAPKCDACPLRSMCEARTSGTQGQIPEARRRAKPQACVHHAIVVRRRHSNLMLIEQRPSTAMWAGMWQVPTIEAKRALSVATLRAALPFALSKLLHCGTFAHPTTHRAITFHVYTATTRARRGTWLAPDSVEIVRLPMSAAQRRVLGMVTDAQ